MKTADLIIIGGGMVGLALAAQLTDLDCRILIVEKNPPNLTACGFSARVSAINAASQRLLMQVGAWQRISPERLSPYQKMTVWEKDSFAHLEFDNQDPIIKQLGLSELGFIVENERLHDALWQQVSQQSNVQIIQAVPQSVGISENGAVLTLNNGEILTAKLLVGADGAHSWLRSQTDIPLVSRDYQHSALVCNVRTAEPHGQTARQIFAPDSILAFLPLAEPNLCSIVWSLPPEKAEALANCDEQAFNKALTVAFDNRLGLCELQNSRQIHPLVARYARDFSQLRIALIGDAAHTIHPLAGLGVNLGFADTILLAAQLLRHRELGNDIGLPRCLRPFERQRKLEAVKILAAMEGLKQLFAGDHPLKKAVRGLGLSLTNQNSMLKKVLIKQAVGL